MDNPHYTLEMFNKATRDRFPTRREFRRAYEGTWEEEVFQCVFCGFKDTNPQRFTKFYKKKDGDAEDSKGRPDMRLLGREERRTLPVGIYYYCIRHKECQKREREVKKHWVKKGEKTPDGFQWLVTDGIGEWHIDHKDLMAIEATPLTQGDWDKLVKASDAKIETYATSSRCPSLRARIQDIKDGPTVSTSCTDGSTTWTSTGMPYLVGSPRQEIFIPNIGGHLEQETPAKENKMKALYRFYAVNRRTGVFLSKEFVGVAHADKAKQTALLENADEIKLNVGAPEECEFVVETVLTYEPIEGEVS